MKRKLDHDNVPAAEVPKSDGGPSFAAFGLDPRLLRGIAAAKFSVPTPVQASAIPSALEGRDILARAKTGSGKTAAYLLPVLQSILKRKQQHTSVLILVPTRELAEQVYKAVESLSTFCAKDVQAVNLTQKFSDAVQRSLLAVSPDIVITTPGRASLNLNTLALSLDHLSHLVIDEADLVLSYGYENDLHVISKTLPKGIQTILMSATLTDEVDLLKVQFSRDPVILKLEEAEDDRGLLSQYVVKCAEDEKFLLIYVIFKLKLIKGKCILFVGDIDRCYRLKLYLEQFGIKSCVLNSELPVNSRIHIVEEFNKNVYDIIIATDENEVLGDEEPETLTAGDTGTEGGEASNGTLETGSGGIKKLRESPEPAGEDDSTRSKDSQRKKKRKNTKRDKEYGISRGIDFKNVACVINFDLPTTSKSYTHRIGRTARAGKTGMALSFVIPKEHYRKHKSTTFPTTENDEAVLAKIIKHQGKQGKQVKPYHFDMAQVEGFRYRMGDALRAVTRLAIREARTRELRQELLKSEKLKRHFEENPGDLQHLRHDGELRVTRIQHHLKHIPDYLLPKGGKRGIASGGELGHVGVRKVSENRIRKARMNNRTKGKGKKGAALRRKVDPLKTFKAKAV
ncbi:ATP-dependent DNA/RNA helicase [Trichoglossum hirsutum]|uniref:RNA helicase n=1 Tax=Trichoglossum hirsutum TaxID=265104 RepID=A0A9P8IDN9_9PEZI|nr:ATP-dependent DNA/RNA helicase [Trichoglossum hirsutum]